MKCYQCRNLLPLGLCFSLLFGSWSPAALAQNLPSHIELIVVEGEGATNSIRQRVTKDPVVKVEDDDHRPVTGAAVVFVLPVSGTSGEFVNGSKTLSVVTDQDGLATARGLRTNQIPGTLQIYVTASFHGLRARTTITQMVEAPPGAAPATISPRSHSHSGGKWKWVLLGVAAGAGAGAGVYFGTRFPLPLAD